MFSNCQGFASQSNISAHTPSHSSYNNYGHHNQQPRGNFFTSCLQAVCGVDPSTVAGRKYQSTMDDNSSITALTQHNLNFEDECRISLSRFTKRVNGRDMRFIQASATLFDDEVDEAHDLFYLVQMPENNNPPLSSVGVANQQQHSSELAVRLLQSQQNHRSNSGGIQLPEQTKTHLGSHQTRKENDLAKSDPTQTNQVNNALRFLHRQTNTVQRVNQLAANGAYQSSTGGPADFINQHTGSFTFHPAQTSEPGNRSFSGTHSSSQPNFNEKHSEIMGNMAIDVPDQDEAVRCDTDTHRQMDDQPRMHEMLKHSPARLMDSSILRGNNGDRNHVDYGASSTSSIMLQERHGQQVAVASGRRMMPRLPRTYGDLIANYTVQVKKDKKSGQNNVALGCFPLSKVPDGKYRIYYFRPKNRNRLMGGGVNSSSAQDKIQRVGKGQEFYIFDKNSSQSPSKHSASSKTSFDHKQSMMSLSSTTQQESIGQYQPSYQQLQSAGRTVPIQQFMKKSVSNKNKRSSKVGAHMNKGGLSRPRVPSMNGQDSHSPNALAAQFLNENGDLSPDEVDLLVCRPDSLESDPMSKESFNTDKIRKENLGQNFANVIRSSGKELNNGDSPNGMYESGLTFGANSAALSNQFAMSGSLKNMQASDTLSGLQEIYTVHQANLGQTAGEDTLKVPSIMTGGGCESPDTPNLYQTMSHASQHTASIEESLHDLAVQVPIFPSDSTGEPKNPDHEFIFPTQSEGSAKNNTSDQQRNGFVLRLNVMNQSPDKNEFQKSKSGAAIRVEKQMSYTRSPSDSSADHTADQGEVQVNNDSGNQGVTSAFKAAENKVRNSQVQMFNQTNEAFQQESQEDSVDIVAPSSEASITNKIMVHETLGPPIIVPSHSQQVDDLINEVVLSPMLNNKKTSGDTQVAQSVETDMEQQNIRFFQQFIDTNGPTMCGGSNMITVMPLTGNIQQSDQSVLAQLGYSTGSSNQIQKHSRAIAFSDGAGVSMDSADQQQPQSLEEEQFLSPNKDLYREMIKHSNNQNNTAVNYEQLTRNSGNNNQNCQKVMHTAPLGYSDKKQLSTVEEENASQCSDLTSLQHHHSRFMQTQQSSKSRKSLNRNSQQPGPLHQQNGGNQNAPGSFCISEEPSETDIGDQAIEVVDLDVAQPYISDNKRISLIQETGTSCSPNVTDEKLKYLQQMSSANVSANSTKTCSKQLSAQIKEGHLISGIQSLKIEGKPSQLLSRPEMMNSSDYYSLKTSSPRQPQNQENDTNKLEDTSSSLLDLDNNDFNITNELISPGQSDHQNGRALTEEQRQVLSLSPYLLSPGEQSKKNEPISNFKSKRSLKRTGQDQLFQSQDKEHSQESELIESVNLNCSENFQEEQDVMERQDSTALIQLIDNYQLNPEEQKSTLQSEQTKFVAQTKSSSGTKSTVKGQSSKKSSGKQSTRKRNIFANSGSSVSIKNGHLVVNSQSSSAKENLHSEKDNFTKHVSGLTKKPSFSKSSLKHLTPIINKSSNNQNLKLHQLVQKNVMATPQLNTSCKKKKLDLFANSERKLIFVPTGTSTSQSSPQLTLFSQTSATKGHQHVPPQPLIKSKEIFVGKNSSQSQFLQNTQAQNKVSKKQGLHTGKQHLTTLNAKHVGNLSTVKQTNQSESDKSAAQTTLTKLLMQNARST